MLHPERFWRGVTPFPPSGVFVGLTGRDDRPMLHKILPTIAGLALLAPAVASADDLGQTFQPSPIRAYRGNALWSTAPQGTKTFTLLLNGQPLPVTSAKAPVDADVSRGPSGAPTVVVARADGLYLLDGSTLKRVVKRTGAHAPTIWGDRIAWVEGRDTIYTATIGQSRVRRVPSPVTGARISEVKLFGQELAISLDTGRTLNDVQAWLQELDGSRTPPRPRAVQRRGRPPVRRPRPSTAARSTSRRSARGSERLPRPRHRLPLRERQAHQGLGPARPRRLRAGRRPVLLGDRELRLVRGHQRRRRALPGAEGGAHVQLRA